MEFELSEEQKQIKASVREFAEAEIAPHVLEWDEAQHFPIELKPKLAELGLMGVIFPEEYGGAGMGYIEYATIIEELSRIDGSIGISVAAHNSLCSNHIYQYGTEDQKRRFLVPRARGERHQKPSFPRPRRGPLLPSRRCIPSNLSISRRALRRSAPTRGPRHLLPIRAPSP